MLAGGINAGVSSGAGEWFAEMLRPLHSALRSGEVSEAPDGFIFGHAVNVIARLQGEANAQ